MSLCLRGSAEISLSRDAPAYTVTSTLKSSPPFFVQQQISLKIRVEKASFFCYSYVQLYITKLYFLHLLHFNQAGSITRSISISARGAEQRGRAAIRELSQPGL